MKIIPFEELTKLVKRLEACSTSGYHRVYQETKIKEAIAAYNRFLFLKYIWFKPRYRKLIKQAQQKLVTS